VVDLDDKAGEAVAAGIRERGSRASRPQPQEHLPLREGPHPDLQAVATTA